MNTYQLRRIIGNTLFYLMLGIFMLVILLPIYYIFLTAFTTGDQLFTKPLSYLPQSFAIDRFRAVFNGFPIHRYMFNTCLLYTTPSPRDALLSRMPSSG
jgi:multiple sugar transport system permease protein